MRICIVETIQSKKILHIKIKLVGIHFQKGIFISKKIGRYSFTLRLVLNVMEKLKDRCPGKENSFGGVLNPFSYFKAKMKGK